MTTQKYEVGPAQVGDRGVGIYPLPPAAGIFEIVLPKGAGIFDVTTIAVPLGRSVLGLDELASKRPTVVDAPALVMTATTVAEELGPAATERRYFAIVPAGSKAPPLGSQYLGCVTLGGRLAVLVFELPIPSEPAEAQPAFDLGGPVP